MTALFGSFRKHWGTLTCLEFHHTNHDNLHVIETDEKCEGETCRHNERACVCVCVSNSIFIVASRVVDMRLTWRYLQVRAHTHTQQCNCWCLIDRLMGTEPVTFTLPPSSLPTELYVCVCVWRCCGVLGMHWTHRGSDCHSFLHMCTAHFFRHTHIHAQTCWSYMYRMCFLWW